MTNYTGNRVQLVEWTIRGVDNLRSRPRAWVTVDDGHVGVLLLIPPQTDGIGYQIRVGATSGVARVRNYCQILTTLWEFRNVVARIMLHGTLFHIVGGQTGQYGTPAYGGHAASCCVAGQHSQGQVITSHIVQTHHVLTQRQSQIDQHRYRTFRADGGPGLKRVNRSSMKINLGIAIHKKFTYPIVFAGNVCDSRGAQGAVTIVYLSTDYRQSQGNGNDCHNYTQHLCKSWLPDGSSSPFIGPKPTTSPPNVAKYLRKFLICLININWTDLYQ